MIYKNNTFYIPFLFSLFLIIIYFRAPIEYMENQYYLNYDIEFIKRGLLGHFFFLVGYNVVFLKFLFFGVCLFINFIICSQKFSFDDDDINSFKEILIKIFFISTPAITNFYKWSFSLDVNIFFLALILILSIVRYQLWVAAFMIVFVSIVGIMIHEIYASYYFLLLLSIFIHKFRNINFIIPLSVSILLIFITIFYLLVLEYGSIKFENIELFKNSLPNNDSEFVRFMSSSAISDFKILFNNDQLIKISINLLLIFPSIYCFYLIISSFSKSKYEFKKIHIFLILFFCFWPAGNIFFASDHSRFIFAVLNNLVLINIYFLKTKMLSTKYLNNNILIIFFLVIIFNLLIGPSDQGNPPVSYYKIIELRDFLFNNYLKIWLL